MRNILLSVVVIAVLVGAGIGGTLATWSDSETSAGNTIETGSMDLVVNGADDAPWGTGVPQKVAIECMIPEKQFGPYEVELWNAGQCTETSSAYIHIKNAICENVPAKEGSGYVDPETGVISPEPELVAQYGGKVDCTEVPGVGRLGDNCCMASFITIWIYLDDGTLIYEGPIEPIVCEEIYLMELEPCQPRTIYLYFQLWQPSEEDFGLNYIPSPEELGLAPGDEGYDAALMEWMKFNDWPSAVTMKDKITFDMEFDLVLWDP
jgi:predicted ribosomally synthesized peptide with SipW-like signal peptide